MITWFLLLFTSNFVSTKADTAQQNLQIFSERDWQADGPVPAEGMRMAIAELLNVGMKPEELISLTRENPINLVGI